MKYKKEYIKSDGRKLTGGGPRDLQRQQQQQQVSVIDHSDVIEELKNEVHRLSDELKDRPVIGGFSGDQMDNEIRAAVTESVKDLKKEKQQLIKKLKEINDRLEKIKEEHSKEIKILMKEHSEKLEQLTESIIKGGSQNQEVEDYEDDRPKMVSEFVDPLEEDAGRTLEPFLDVKDTSTDDQPNMLGKIDKLKEILGKLPSQK